MVVLGAMDGIITRFLISSGLAYEGNSLLKPLVGEHIFIPVKVVGAAAAAFLFWDIHRRHPRLALVVTSCVVAAYAGIVLWNFAILFRAQI